MSDQSPQAHSPSTSPDPLRKPCPFCAESIPAAAVWCRFCKTDLGTGAVRETHQPGQPTPPVTADEAGEQAGDRAGKASARRRIVTAAVVASVVVVTAAAAAHSSRSHNASRGPLRGYDITYIKQTTQQQYVHDQGGCGGVGFSEADCLSSATSGQWVTVPGPAVTEHDIVCAHSVAEARALAPEDATVTGKTVDTNCAE